MLLIVFGTRPEYIKVKSLIDHLSDIKTLYIGQHTTLLPNVYCDYFIQIEDTCVNRLNSIIVSVLKFSIPSCITKVLVQGDTSAALSMALCAFNHNIPVIHLEAGLRTNNITNPYPEELNRQLISRIASVHLCPTNLNRLNLLKENILGQIHVVGNTGLDNIDKTNITYTNKILITLHRRDNHNIIDQWFIQLECLANKYCDHNFILPIHPNPNIMKFRSLLKTVHVINPIPHEEMISLIKQCKFIISDSGGIQEEASYLRKKIIICREDTERPEVLLNHGYLCKTVDSLEGLVDMLMHDYFVDENIECPFGSGDSWNKIDKIIS